MKEFRVLQCYTVAADDIAEVTMRAEKLRLFAEELGLGQSYASVLEISPDKPRPPLTGAAK